MNDDIFEGGFRRLPEQNLAGASKHTRKGDFLQKIHLDRINRQLEVKKNKCAVKIQALIRGFLTRRRVKHYRENILVTRFTNSCSRDLELQELGDYLVAYYYLNTLAQPEILIWLSKRVMSFHVEIITNFATCNSCWLWKIRWLLKVHLKKLNLALGGFLSSATSSNLFITLQLLELFTNFELICTVIGENAASTSLKEIILYIVKNGYFDAAKSILHMQDPKVAGINDNQSLESYVQQIVQRPFNLINSTDNKFGTTVLQETFKSFFGDRMTPETKNTILPIISKINNEAITCLVMSVNDGTVEATAPSLYILLDFFKKGYHSKFSKLMEALSILLRGIALNYPRANLHSSISEEFNHEMEVVEEDDEEIDEDDDDAFSDVENTVSNHFNSEMLYDTFKYLKSIEFSMDAINYLDMYYCEETLTHFSKFLYVLITKHTYVQYKILWYVSLHPVIYKDLWELLSCMNRMSLDNKPVSLLTLLSRGNFLTPHEAEIFYPILITFCLVFKRYICMLHNAEITETGNSAVMSFSVSKITEITIKLRDVAVSLLHIGLPVTPINVSGELKRSNISAMKESFKAIVLLLKVLHSREIGPDQTFWISNRIIMPQSLPFLKDWTILAKHVLFEEKTLSDRSVIATNNSAKPFVILRDLPFCVPTKDRINLLDELFLLFKTQYQNPTTQFIQENMFIKIRRDYIYEDAFEKLSPNEVPEIRINIKIQLTSTMGYEEAGVDGGGIFREFMTEFLRAAFDPNRGFFLLNKDRQLYPNPNVEVLYNNFKKHYFFIGRMLAKALYENILVELPLAECFISNLVKRDKDVNLYDLHSLDPELFKNLISLRSYEGDFSNLGLNYTAVSDLYGQTKVTELITEGEKISVNRANKIDYIHTVADYKLNTQIEAQCSHFRQGIASVFSIFWLAIFSAKELQKLIFCSDSPIDVDDLKNNCYYTGGYSSSHPNIVRFWKVFEEFEDAERKQLLKFVTSCSRQPLLGFKDLDPPFTIQLVESSDRLPTSSTCMNLLKLPVFQDENIMKEKLLYSIQSQAGFDLC